MSPPRKQSRTPDDDALRHRLAEVLIELDVLSANDFTMDGQFAADDSHTPNARQNTIGKLFQRAHQLGLIEHAGLPTIKSTAPHRKGGRIEQWRTTDLGRAWAREVLAR